MFLASAIPAVSRVFRMKLAKILSLETEWPGTAGVQYLRLVVDRKDGRPFVVLFGNLFPFSRWSGKGNGKDTNIEILNDLSSRSQTEQVKVQNYQMMIAADDERSGRRAQRMMITSPR